MRANPAHIRLTDEIKVLEPGRYLDGVARWIEILKAQLRECIAEGDVRPLDEEELTAQAHFLLGGRHFPEALVDGVGRDEVVDSYMNLVRGWTRRLWPGDLTEGLR